MQIGRRTWVVSAQSSSIACSHDFGPLVCFPRHIGDNAHIQTTRNAQLKLSFKRRLVIAGQSSTRKKWFKMRDGTGSVSEQKEKKFLLVLLTCDEAAAHLRRL